MENSASWKVMAVAQTFALMAMSTPVSAASKAPAGVIEQFEILEERLAFGGTSFGKAGQYELIRAKAHLRVSPQHPGNRGIVDLKRAPRTPTGDVRYAADVLILRPRDPALARRVIFAEVPNRGLRLAFGLNDVSPAQAFSPREVGKPFSTPGSAGNGFLMRRGYTLVWVGWQANFGGGAGTDQTAALPRMRAELPVATAGGRPITGRVEATGVFDTTEAHSDLRLPYPAAAGAKQEPVLTVRARPQSIPRVLPRSSWALVNPLLVRIQRPAEMEAGAIYQFIYTAENPIVGGLGFAATRDVVSWLRRGEKDEAGTPNPLLDLRKGSCALASAADCTRSRDDTVDLVIGSGSSQSGRYLRDMVWQGFNDDGSGRRVFDGLLVQIAGARKTFTNQRWADASRFSRQHEDPWVYGNQFPFGYAVTDDPLTRRRDGIFVRCQLNDTCPSVFHIDGSSEFWNAGASLVASDGAGKDVPLPSSVRAYMIAGAPHAPGMTGPSSLLPANPLTTAPVLRSLLIAMDDWLARKAEPPASRWPMIARGELAPPEQQDKVGFPHFHGLPYSGTANPVMLTDYNRVPPRVDLFRRWQVLVPVTDADGNDRPGIRLPEIEVPQGTYLGWNPRKPGYAEGDLSFLFGAFVPFAENAAVRTANKDPRLSLAERYASETEFQRMRKQSKDRLIHERLFAAE